MKILITIVVLLIAAAAVYFVCTTRANAVEHYVCTGPAATGLTIDYPKRIATVAGGLRAGDYKGIDVTAEEVAWQKQDEFTFNRRSGRFAIMKNEQGVVSISTAQCEPASMHDRIVRMVD